MRILVVDDEKWMRDSLRTLIAGRLKECHIIAEAENGLEGLTCIRRHHPDVVLADIKMPGLSGLELMEAAVKESPAPRFVFLSGYSLFEYAQNAVNLGAYGYLLKPVEPEELFGLLERVRSVIDSERARTGRRNPENALRDSLLGTDTADTRSYLTALLPEELGEIAVLAIRPAGNGRPDPVVANILRQTAKKNGMTPIVFQDMDQGACLLAQRKGRARWDIFLEKAEDLFAVGATAYYGGLSKIVASADLDCLPDLYRQALLALDARKLNPGRSITRIEELSAVRQPRLLLDNGLERLLTEAVEWMDDCIADQVMEETRCRLTKRGLQLVELQHFCDRFYHIIYYSASAAGADSAVYLEPSKIRDIIGACDTVEEVLSILQAYLSSVIKRLSEQTASFNRNLSESIKKYIAEHYQEDVSLYTLSDVFHFHPKYISKVFKNDVGVNFVEYLTTYRLQIAKELLRKQRYSNGDIAKAVGYSDASYFAKVFKKAFRLSPNQFAKLGMLKKSS